MFNLEVPQWYVVYSKAHKEEFAKHSLMLKGLEVFYPRLLLPNPSRSRKRIIPLFPNYLFVRFRISTESHYVVWCPGVKKIVSFDGTPATVEEKVVAFLMQQASPDGLITAQPNIKAGQEVRITGGPFAGLVGIIQNPPNPRGRVKVLMKLLNREVKVDVPVEFVDAKWGAATRPAGASDIGLGLSDLDG
jgi:transcriptional antiterminator RfaH